MKQKMYVLELQKWGKRDAEVLVIKNGFRRSSTQNGGRPSDLKYKTITRQIIYTEKNMKNVTLGCIT